MVLNSTYIIKYLSRECLSLSPLFKTSDLLTINSNIQTGIMWNLVNKSTCDLLVGHPSSTNLKYDHLRIVMLKLEIPNCKIRYT